MNKIVNFVLVLAFTSLLIGCGDKNEGATADSSGKAVPEQVAKHEMTGPELFIEAGKYRDGIDGHPYDREKARALYKQGAEMGERDCEYFLGMMYENGEGGPVDNQLAVEWLTKSAAQDNGGAADRLKHLKARLAKEAKKK